jgi:hypothetical protein
MTKSNLPLEFHDRLNPRIWSGTRLKPEVKQALLNIADDFVEFVGLDFPVVDLVIVGAQVNYAYTEHSDLDLHLVTDYSKISCDREVEELFDSKRLLYKQQFNVTIHGIPVEPYVEDVDDRTVSSRYSVLGDRWLKHPELVKPEPDMDRIEHWVDVWHRAVRGATMTGDLNTCRTVLKLLRAYRKAGLARQGEFGVANLVYKSLRNDNTLKGIQTLVDRLHSQALSI